MHRIVNSHICNTFTENNLNVHMQRFTFEWFICDHNIVCGIQY